VDPWEALYFLLDSCTDADTAVPEQIPKTIIFIDGRQSVQEAAAYLQRALLAKTSTFAPGNQYTTDANNKTRCVTNVVQVYTARVQEYDRTIRYEEFKKSSSAIRIMVATTSLGMGVNVPDVGQVVLWKFPITKSLADHWQRLGRGGRGYGRTSKGYIFLPYWAFNTEGVNKPENEQPQLQPDAPQKATRRPYRNRLPADRAIARSQLANGHTPGDASDTESISSQISASTQAPAPVNKATTTKFWSKAEMSHRAGLSAVWMEMINGICHRKAFLTYLGENKLPLQVKTRVPPDQCCSRCNPALLPTLTQAPDTPQPITQPRSGSRPYIALTLINKWAATQAEALCGVNRRFPLPPDGYMNKLCRWQLAYIYKLRPDFWDTLTFDRLCIKAPLLQTWPYREKAGDLLVEQLQDFVQKVDNLYTEMMDARNAKKQQQLQELQGRHDRAPNISVSDYNAAIRKRDDTLAAQVARREALRAAQMRATETAGGNGCTLGGARDSRLGEWVNSVIGTPVSPSLTLPVPPDGISEGIQRAIRQLEQARILGADIARHSPDSSQLDVQQPVVSVSDTQNNTTPSRKRQRRDSTEPITPLTRQLPLAERDPDIGKILNFTPVSRRGRIRHATPKGKENFRVNI